VSFGNSRVTTPHGREWTRPLHVLAVQCPLQTTPDTQPPVCYIHTTQTHNGIYRASIASHDKIYQIRIWLAYG